MSDHPPPAATPPIRPLNRWGIGALSLLQLLFCIVIIITVNYLSLNHYARVDLSRAEDYSLAPSTKRYLKEGALKAREHPIRWVLCYRRSAPLYERVRALAEEYARLSGKRIELEVVDPLRSPDRMQAVASAYGIPMVRDMIIIDARTDDHPVVREDASGMKSLHPHVRVLAAEEMGVFTVVDGKRKLTAFRGEDVLTAALVSAVEGGTRKMALLADKSRLESEADLPLRKSLEELLRFQNVSLVDIRISELREIPADLSGLILAAPKYDFTESEMAVLKNYWNNPRAAILVLADPLGVPPELRAFVRENGVTVRNDRIIARQKNTLVTRVRGVFTQGVPFISDLAGQSTEFGGASASLNVREGAPDLSNRRILPMGLIEASPGFWGESKFGTGDEVFNEGEDYAPPLYLAASITRGAESDDRFAADSSRMIVMSNIDFLAPVHRRAENMDFLASSTNWLIGREELAGIGPRTLDIYKLPLLDVQVTFINRINLFFMPALFLMIGAFVWSSRRV